MNWAQSIILLLLGIAIGMGFVLFYYSHPVNSIYTNKHAAEAIMNHEKRLRIIEAK